MRKVRFSFFTRGTQTSSGRAGIQTQVVRLENTCLDQGSLQLWGGVGGGPELGQKDNLEFAKEEGAVRMGGLSQLGSACAKVSCLAGKVEPKPGASQG